MTEPLIRLQGIQKYYGDYHALRGVDLDIRAGEFFSLLGPSGCGKTTLLRVIAGFEGVTEGTVMIGGTDMTRLSPNRRPTNMVFQSYAIFPHLTVAQNVGFGLRKRSDLNRQAKDTLVDDALDMVGLDGYGKRAAHALSGGQRQRVALARALVLRPKVLLLDEPLSALDRKMREQMQVELIRLQRQVGITFILVTHDQEEALVMSDRIAVMFEGEIAQLAEAEALYRRPVSRRVAEFIGVMNFLPATVDGDVVDAAGLGKMVVQDLQSTATTAGDPMVGFRPETATLLFPGQQTEGRVAEGRVVEVVYYGDMTYYDVTLDGAEKPVRISMRNVFGRPVLDIGTQARLAWSPGAITLFR
ncbi:ABC transporter ATP-binding protein [Jannaschia rubra]|uniref:Spermidine/putrescine import ATP-binding protein PotA n=1 Tax=Jannaschia rubra TaxID=282197 RepID=A0A0M6XW46_9RHOB|nr:ABC transporter ATP-binding protein [Jannaschia rubra]CTQ34325.1 Spermidine/putrescine import ATP-binding protein PotA [Jannaschia rubra]SFG17835.1 spermidine/putrescine transport system ATP-binding protein [Jannaschia rubra]